MRQPILIIGAGLGGLALAQGLRKLEIPFHVYERDASISSRPQGYRIRVSGEGLEALETCLGPDVWSELCKTFAWEDPDGDFLKNGARMDLKTGEKLPAPNINRPPSKTRPRAFDRTTTRRVLMGGIEDHVSYGKAFARYEVSDSGVTAYFQDGSSASGRLLVGAEGVASAVRRQHAPALELLDTEGWCIYGKSPLSEQLLAAVSPYMLGGMGSGKDNDHEDVMTALTEPFRFDREAGAGLTLPEDYIYWVLASKAATFREFVRSNEAAADAALELTKGYHPSVRAIWEMQDRSQTSMLKIAMAHPDQQAWQSDRRVTLLGDAAHAMSPTAGLGCTAVFCDVARLCSLLRNKELGDDMIAEYEQGMRADAKRFSDFSIQGAKNIFGMKDVSELKPVVSS